MKEKAQIWSLDIIIASVIFFAGVVVIYVYALNSPTESESILNTMNYDANIIASNLLSEGSPPNWSSENVVMPGLLTKGKINQTKLERFYNLTNEDYEMTKKIFNTKYDFYIFFTENMTIEQNTKDGIGKAGVNRDNIITHENPENIIKITRFTIYKNKPTQLNLYIWK